MPEDNIVYVVAEVETSEGMKPAVVAMHETIADRLGDLFVALHKCAEVDWQLDTSDIAELERTFSGFIKSPQAIVDAVELQGD